MKLSRKAHGAHSVVGGLGTESFSLGLAQPSVMTWGAGLQLRDSGTGVLPTLLCAVILVLDVLSRKKPRSDQ